MTLEGYNSVLPWPREVKYWGSEHCLRNDQFSSWEWFSFARISKI